MQVSIYTYNNITEIPVAVGPLLQKYHHPFQEPQNLPPERDNNHQIHLNQGIGPVDVKLYQYMYFQEKEIEKLATEMLATGIIRHSTSPFSSLILLVKRKDGSRHFCVDYLALNQITIRDRFPMPIVDELLDELFRATCVSVFPN